MEANGKEKFPITKHVLCYSALHSMGRMGVMGGCPLYAFGVCICVHLAFALGVVA